MFDNVVFEFFWIDKVCYVEFVSYYFVSWIDIYFDDLVGVDEFKVLYDIEVNFVKFEYNVDCIWFNICGKYYSVDVGGYVVFNVVNFFEGCVFMYFGNCDFWKDGIVGKCGVFYIV